MFPSLITRREFIKTTSMAALAIALPVEVFAAGTTADLVVYGKIFTAENNRSAEAFAVKDGRFIYVGDKRGAEAFINKGKTEIIDYSGKGLIMPSCGNGHAHYSMANGIKSAGTIIDRGDSVEKFLTEVVPAAVAKAKAKGATAIFGQGWRLLNFQDNMPTRQDLDAICSDIPMYFLDDECHKALTNTILLVQAGIMNADGTAGKTEIRGGEIKTDANGIPTGFLSEQAQTYVRSFLDNDNLYTLDMATANLADIEHHLLSEGYTMYHEGWGNYFVNMNYYKAARQLDKAGKLHFVLGLPYEIESWMDVDEALAKAVDAKKFSSKRVMPNWTEEELTDITRRANENGITMHVHVMGNAGVTRVVNAFINGGKDEMRNTLVHVYSVNQSDYKRMAEHNIQVAAGLLRHHADEELQEDLLKILPANMADKGYPMKSFFDYGVNISSHSDYPALSGSPDDPFGIMEIALTGVYYPEHAKAWWTEELITREQALYALTLGVAKQMFLENERGSIRQGKYADFLLVNKDVLTCPVKEIHDAKPAATYFEGKKVFSM